MPGRKQDCVWMYFDKCVNTGKAGSRAKCKSCSKEMQGLVARMKQHYNLCVQQEANASSTTSASSSSSPSTPVYNNFPHHVYMTVDLFSCE